MRPVQEENVPLVQSAISAISRCPREIWRMIINAAVAAEYDTDVHNGVDCSIRIHDRISKAERGTSSALDAERPVGSPAWLLERRARKRLVLVCRTWWALGITDIYFHVYLYRAGQLLAFVRTLETREGSALQGPTFSDMVRQVTIDLYLLPKWESVYCGELPRMLRRCPNLRSLDIRSIRTFIPFSQTYIPSRTRPLRRQESRETEEYAQLDKLEHLALGDPHLMPLLAGRMIRPTFKNIVSLEVALYTRHDLAHELLLPNHGSIVEFPELLRLRLLVAPRSTTMVEIETISDNWRIPKLSSLSIVNGSASLLQLEGKTHPQVPNIISLCSRFGETLEHIHIECGSGCGIHFTRDAFTQIFHVCPLLRTMGVPCFIRELQSIHSDEGDHLKFKHEKLETLTVFLLKKHVRRITRGSPGSLIYNFNQKDRFPSLSNMKIVRFCSQKIQKNKPKLRRVRRWVEEFERTGQVRCEVLKSRPAGNDEDEDIDDKDFIPSSEGDLEFDHLYEDSDPGEDSGLEDPSTLKQGFFNTGTSNSKKRKCPSICCLRKPLKRQRKSNKYVGWADALERFEASTRRDDDSQEEE